MKQSFKHFSLFVVASLSCIVLSCSKDDDPKIEENENEVITTIKLKFKEQGSKTEMEYSWKDADGVGGKDPIIDQIVLQPEKSYEVSLSFIDEVNGGDVTNEVREENTAHRVYYVPSSTSNIQISDLDKDDNKISLGLNAIWKTSTTSMGTMRLVLRHYPNEGKEEADQINDTKSSTDIDIQFDYKVQ